MDKKSVSENIVGDFEDKKLFEEKQKEFVLAVRKLQEEYKLEFMPTLDYLKWGIAPRIEIVPSKDFYKKWKKKIITPNKNVIKPNIVVAKK